MWVVLCFKGIVETHIKKLGKKSESPMVEHPPGVRKVMGSNPTGDSDFFPSLFICVSTIPLKHKATHIQQPLQYLIVTRQSAFI